MNECCKKPENLELILELVGDDDYLKFRKCKVCGRRHFELALDPGKLGLELGP